MHWNKVKCIKNDIVWKFGKHRKKERSNIIKFLFNLCIENDEFFFIFGIRTITCYLLVGVVPLHRYIKNFNY